MAEINFCYSAAFCPISEQLGKDNENKISTHNYHSSPENVRFDCLLLIFTTEIICRHVLISFRLVFILPLGLVT